LSVRRRVAVACSGWLNEAAARRGEWVMWGLRTGFDRWWFSSSLFSPIL
jgi:hypothetical protein